jgi:4-amino-4-deoxy-L-arabinose transferase-like glycosyltransferase
MRRTSYLAIIISILAVAVRFILIEQPFIDHWSWRESDVAAIARNYFQSGFHFAYPQIDWAGSEPGYVGTEFPILPFVAALCYKSFGIHEWIGRVQGVILFALSLPFFFLLARKNFDENAALWALGFYSFAPLQIMASRCFMPDVPSLALSIVGLYLFDRWIENERSRAAFVWSALCISLSILIKATSVVIAAPLFGLAFQRFKWRAFRQFDLWLFAAIALVPSAIWYGHAYQIAQHFYPHHQFGAGGLKIMPLSWYWDIAKQIPTMTLTPVLFLAGVAGLFVARGRPGARPFYWWLGAMIIFIIIVGFGNRHPWYRLPLVPIFAVFGGAACAFVAKKISSRGLKVTLSIFVIAFFALPSFIYTRKLYEPTAAPMRDAGLLLQKISTPVALIMAADNGDPTMFYYAERRGWHFLETGGIYNGEPTNSEEAIVDLERIRKRGASYLVFTSNTSWWLDYYQELGRYVASNSTLVQATPEFKIYKVNPMSR